MKKTNILSYFIKDIKDPIEMAKYSQSNSEYDIKILYDPLVLIYHHSKYYNYIYNYNNNITKSSCLRYIYTNSKFSSNSIRPHKYLYYNKDNKIKHHSSYSYNYIEYHFICYKYMCKIYYRYRIDYYSVLSIKIKYYNRSKYIYYENTYNIQPNKYKSQILIMNKYELQFRKRFLYLYFAI